ncbi:MULTISPECIES: hypothetical protein [Microbacterium]|uniref:DUF2262 domain-containing protein n=1 Tax=Microbacterium oxydans TaxID=82380 RepID=A0A3Q9J634_9MICO|nr:MULTISPECIES: hypothetical protein [Microbacterium]AZS40078.1 hypothetical protein CVS54_01400 [Microbacterium oxydans]
MSNETPTIDDPELGTFTRARSELTDGTVLTHDWFVGTISVHGTDLELMMEGTAPDEVEPLLPRLRDTVKRLDIVRRIATDAVVTKFSAGEPGSLELDEASTDLAVEAIEAAADGTVVLHLTDGCGEHFPEGYWPAVHLGVDDSVVEVTVES